MRLEVWEADGTRSFANWSYHGTDWRGRCEGAEGDVEFRARDPPHWPLFNTRAGLEAGDDVRAWYLDGCAIRSLDATFDGASGGRLFASASGFRTSWDAATGLVVEWERAGSFGRLATTDAPVG